MPDLPEETLQIGASRPPLLVDDLPSPEQVFHVPRLDGKTILRYVLGPSMIALGVSIGSGEWLLGPLAFARYGFMGVGWLVTISAVLQTCYNMEAARFTLATGEVPSVAFLRIPPGRWLWAPVTLGMIYLGWIWGGWASAAGQSLYALFAGQPADMSNPLQLETVRLLGIGLMFLSLGLYLFGRKIERTLEVFNTFAVWFVLAFLTVLAVALAPLSSWGAALASLVTPAPVPAGMDITLLGAIIGYTGFGAGFNFMLINYYRDKGYGMGHKVGFIGGLIGGERSQVRASGVTFRESAENTRAWGRWWRFLALDQWGIFFTGAMLGMLIPGLLVSALAAAPGAAQPTTANMPIYAASELGRLYGPWLFYLTLAVGAFTLFKTQATVLEMLIRNTADAAYSLFPRLEVITGGDLRKVYYPLALAFVLLISVIIHLALPTELLKISANMANLAAIIFPLAVLYLNARLPRPARLTWWSTLLLLLNVLFFGFFFVNFLSVLLSGSPLVSF